MTLAFKQVMVTGATGFIGSALARGLAQHGHAVRAIVRKTHDLVSVDDIVQGLWQCANVPGVEGRTYVLGSASPVTLRSFADEIAHAAGAPSVGDGPPLAPYQALVRLLAFLYRTTGIHSHSAHNREALVANKVASSARARTELGYAPSHAISDAIRAMVVRFAAVENSEAAFR